MEETDLEWMRELHARLSDPDLEKLSKPEFERFLKAIHEYGLLTQMYSAKMFGGYGMRIFEHPIFPGLPPTKLLSITEDHIPAPTQYDHLIGEARPKHRERGCGRDDAWEIFSKFTHSEQNRQWLRRYGMTDSMSREQYDY